MRRHPATLRSRSPHRGPSRLLLRLRLRLLLQPRLLLVPRRPCELAVATSSPDLIPLRTVTGGNIIMYLHQYKSDPMSEDAFNNGDGDKR